jgi:HD superfamily phosphohydrolase
MPEFKTIHDTVHGSVRVEGVIRDLMETYDFQRLGGVRQLGLAYLVFPGANHTRFEHSLGTSHVAGEMASALGLSAEERTLVRCAALLHDVGHGPFSHTLEATLHRKLGVDHMELTKQIIRGEKSMVGASARKALPKGQTICEVLEKNGVPSDEVAELVHGKPYPSLSQLPFKPGSHPMFGGRRYLCDMVHSAFDADQIDYLLRDAHYTGVAHGGIDVDRLVNTLALHKGEMVVHEKGVSAVEGMLVARALMFTSVYFHKTVRIAELMISRAVEDALGEDMPDVQGMVDWELMAWLGEQGDYQKKMAQALKYRSLYKKAYGVTLSDLGPERRERLAALGDFKKLRRVEDAICDRADAPRGSVMIDLPHPDLLLSEPRIGKADVRVLTPRGIKSFSSLTPFGRAIRDRHVSNWVIMVAADRRHISKVQKVAERVLFG